jgi:hypothetical protein
VRLLFGAPYWIEPDRRDTVATKWLGCMKGYQIDLSDYESTSESAVIIYEHLASRAMPLTSDATQFWPASALEELRQWIEAGCPRTPEDPVKHRPMPPLPARERSLRVRRNILDLSEADLAQYRARLEDLGATSTDSDAVWQRVAHIHTDWCLHYQEAFLLWHRANLLYFEELVGMPIPYWNFMSPQATVDGSPDAGLPQPFRDLTYIHPRTGEERPNPLRFAVAKDGVSKACAPGSGFVPAEAECRYVHRDPVLYTSGEDHRAQRDAKLALIGHFQYQVAFALSWNVFSSPEGTPGYPWANILTFNPPPPDSDYPHRTDFDGLYEQPHDNFHGWVGADMADNAYTAFDPVFWSYHANIDRVFEVWNRAHPAATFTSNYPLRPFVGADAGRIDPTGSDAWRYTTIGDMARDSRALGYDYTAPSVPDAQGTPPGGTPADAAAARAAEEHLYILFPRVRCIHETYILDVFVNLGHPTANDLGGSHHVGRMTRLGMGVEDDKGRCATRGITRIMDATHNAQMLGLTSESPITVALLVRHAHSRNLVAAADYQRLPGFRPILQWGGAMPRPAPRPPERKTPCH